MAAVSGSDPFEVDGSQRLKLLDVGQGSVLREPEEAVLTQPCAAKHGAAEGAPRDEPGRDRSRFSGTEPCSGEEAVFVQRILSNFARTGTPSNRVKEFANDLPKCAHWFNWRFREPPDSSSISR